MNRVFICGDTHGGQAYDAKKLTSKKWPESKTLDSGDFLIVAGDFGFIWNKDNPSPEETWWYNWFSDKPYTVLFVDGNHENFDRINALPVERKFGGEVGVLIPDNIYHLRRGEVYTIAGMKFFTFGGGTSIDKARRTPFVSWWPQEEPKYFEYQVAYENLEYNNWNVDFVITHDCPESTYNEMEFPKYETYGPSQLQKFLEDIKSKLTYKEWYFGHYHEDHFYNDKLTVLYDKIREVFSDGHSEYSNT